MRPAEFIMAKRTKKGQLCSGTKKRSGMQGKTSPAQGSHNPVFLRICPDLLERLLYHGSGYAECTSPGKSSAPWNQAGTAHGQYCGVQAEQGRATTCQRVELGVLPSGAGRSPMGMGHCYSGRELAPAPEPHNCLTLVFALQIPSQKSIP